MSVVLYWLFPKTHKHTWIASHAIGELQHRQPRTHCLKEPRCATDCQKAAGLPVLTEQSLAHSLLIFG